MSIFFGPLGDTVVTGAGAMDGEVRFDAFGVETTQAGSMLGFLAFAFDGATSRSARAVEFSTAMDAGIDFPVEATGGYARSEVSGVDANFGPSVFVLRRGGYMVGDVGFIGEAVGPAVQPMLFGISNIGVYAYGVVGVSAASVEEDFRLSASERVDLSILVEQPLVFGSPVVSRQDASRAVADEVRFGLAIELTYRLLVAEGLLLSDTPTGRYAAVARAMDALRLSGVVSSESQALSVVVAAVMFGLRTDDRARAVLGDGLRFGDSFAAQLRFATQLVEGLLLGDTASGAAIVAVAAHDSVILSSTPRSAAQLFSLLRESLGFGVRLSLDDGEYVAWALNTGSKHLARYENFPVDSFAVLDGRLYGALDDGIYLLEGPDDAGTPIDARVRFALTDMGTGKQKRVSNAYFGYTAENDLLLKVVHTTEGGGKNAYVYRLNAAPATELVNGRASFGGGVSSAYYAFELQNVDGGMFRVESLSVVPMALERRVKRS